jgi:hypothetical protein
MQKKCPEWSDVFGFTVGDAQSVGDELRKHMPPSCTYEKYIRGEGCGLKFPISALNVDLEMVVAQCPNGNSLPYVSLKCAGEGCVDVLKPCSADTDCGSAGQTTMSCQKVCEAPTPQDMQNEIGFLKVTPDEASSSDFCPKMSASTVSRVFFRQTTHHILLTPPCYPGRPSWCNKESTRIRTSFAVDLKHPYLTNM